MFLLVVHSPAVSLYCIYLLLCAAIHARLLTSCHCLWWLPQVMLERACKAAAERAENDFRALLLAQQQEGAINARSTWSAVKAQVSCRSAAGCLCLAVTLARCCGAVGCPRMVPVSMSGS